MESTNESVAIFYLIITSLILFITSITVVSFIDQDVEQYFQIYEENESFIESYPPFENQSTVFENVNENEFLTVNDTDETGIFQTEIIKNNLVEWNNIIYNNQKGSGTITITTSNDENFSEIIESNSYELQSGTRTIDLTDYENSENLRIDLILEDNIEFKSLEISGTILEFRSVYADWMFYLFPVFVLMLMLYIFYGIVSIKL